MIEINHTIVEEKVWERIQKELAQTVLGVKGFKTPHVFISVLTNTIINSNLDFDVLLVYVYAFRFFLETSNNPLITFGLSNQIVWFKLLW